MDLNSSLFWCLVGIIGGAIASFIISLIFYFKGVKKKRLAYEIDTTSLISNNINQIKELKVKYKSNKITNLHYSKVTIKNIGNVSIEKNDFATACPISISTNGRFLLNKSNEIDFYNTHTANNIQPNYIINKDNICNQIIINVDYMPKNYEFACSFFHSGNISLDGVLKDGKILNIKEAINHSKVAHNIYKVASIVTVIAFLVAITITFATTTLRYKKYEEDALYKINNLEQQTTELQYELEELHTYIFYLETQQNISDNSYFYN